jgi:hypothetical protein
MNIIKNILLVVAFLIIMFSDVVGQVQKSEATYTEKKIKLSWEEVEGAVSYNIIIKDSIGNTIIDKELDSNTITLELRPDNYKIRIASINKFGKISTWSDWADLIIEKPVIKQPEKEISSSVLRNFKIGIGGSYFMIQPDWNKYYKDSYYAAGLDISYAFRGVNFPSFLIFMRYTGLDIESNYVKFTDKKAFNNIEGDMTSIISGFNLFISTYFDFPLNFAIRGGGGIAYTILNYKKYDNTGVLMEKGSSSTSATYYKAGISMECSLSSRLFVEACADYYIINYLAMDFKCYRFSCFAGLRF